MALEPWKNPLDFGGIPDHVTLGLVFFRVLQLTFRIIPGRTVLPLDEGRVKPRNIAYVLAGGLLGPGRGMRST